MKKLGAYEEGRFVDDDDPKTMEVCAGGCQFICRKPEQSSFLPAIVVTTTTKTTTDGKNEKTTKRLAGQAVVECLNSGGSPLDLLETATFK